MIEFALILVTAIGPVVGSGSVRGTILSDRNEPVAGVQVELRAENRFTWSDAYGRYEIGGLEPGEHDIRFSRFAYDPLSLTITVPQKGGLDLDVRLRTRFVVQPGISVVATGPDVGSLPALLSSGLPEIGSRELSADVIWSSPLVGQPDVLTPLRTIAGIDMAEENATQLHVRGGSADQNLILLDGVPVYNGYNTSGILSAIPPDAVSRMVAHTGVLPARYGGRLSSVVDVETRTAGREGLEVRGGVGIPDIRLALQSPLPGVDGGVLLAGRRTTYDLIRRGYARRTEDSGFEDVLGKVEVDVLGGALAVVSLHTDNWLSSFAGEEGGPTGFPEGFPDLHNSVGWSSGTDAISWTGSSDDGSEMQLKLFRAASRSNIEWGSVTERHRMHNRLVHWGVSGDLAWRDASSVGRLGVAVERLQSFYQTASRTIGERDQPPEPGYALEARPALVSSYLEQRWIPRDRWLINSGVRAIHVESAGFKFEPRLSLHYRPSDRLTLSGGFGRVHQVVQSLTNEESLLNAAYAIEPLVGAGASGIPLARSDQLAAALEAKLADRLLLTLDGYVRWMDGLVLVAPVTDQPYATAGFGRGRGRAHGIGLVLAYEGDRVDARTVIELSSARRTAGDLTYRPRFERNRSLAMEASWRLTPVTTLTSAFQAAAGPPTSPLADGFDWEVFDQLTGEVEFSGTPVRAPGALNGDRLPAYFRLDLGIRRQWRNDGAGPDGSITTYLDVLNVLDHGNVLGRQLASSGGATRDLALLPRSFLFGVEWRF
ncbi:MAG: TonB-dependent receptor [Gemmatimonadota bacterium]